MRSTLLGIGRTVLGKISQIFLDKYLLAGAIFLVWVGFFDQNSMMTQLSLSQTLHQLDNERDYLLEQIAETELKKKDVVKNQEKYARERYYLKKPGEQVYLLEQ